MFSFNISRIHIKNQCFTKNEYNHKQQQTICNIFYKKFVCKINSYKLLWEFKKNFQFNLFFTENPRLAFTLQLEMNKKGTIWY